MSNFHTVSVPFQTWGNRQVITRRAIEAQPWIAEFVAAFPKCFEADFLNDVMIFYPEGDAPCPNSLPPRCSANIAVNPTT